MFASAISQKSVLHGYSQVSKKISIANEQTSKISKCALFSFLMCTLFIWPITMFFYDFPQLFMEPLINYFEITTIEVSLLYTLPAFLAIFSASGMGFVLNKLGLGLTVLVFNAILFFGGFLCFYSIRIKSFYCLVVGRLLNIAMVELLLALNIAIIEKWFFGRFMSVANGLARFFSSLMMFLAAYYQPIIFIKTRSFEIVLMIYAIVVSLGFFSSAIYFLMERKYEKYLVKVEIIESPSQVGEENFMDYKFKAMDFFKLPTVAKLATPLVGIVMGSYCMFTSFGTDFIMNSYGLTYHESTKMVSILPLIALILTPIVSSIVGAIGKKGIVLFVTVMCAVFAHFSWHLIPPGRPDLVYFPIVLLGIYYGMYNGSLWTSVSIVLPKQAVGGVLSIACGFSNLIFSLFPIIYGYVVKDRTKKSYMKIGWYTFYFTVVSAIIIFSMMIIDLRTGKLLHNPENSEAVDKERNRISRDLAKKGRKSEEDYKSLARKSEGKGLKNDLFNEGV